MTRQQRADVVRAAESLRSDATHREHLNAAAELIRNGAGSELYQALIDQERNSAGDNSFTARLMHLLEAIMPKDAGVGAYLMARLYGCAWRSSEHAIYNGIELWMHNTTSTEAADALLQLSTEPIRPALKKACSSWAKAIRERA